LNFDLCQYAPVYAVPANKHEMFQGSLMMK